MFDRYQTPIDRIIRSVLNTPGETNPALRRTLLARAKAQIGSPNPSEEALPPQLAEFVDKVAPSARDIGDEDFAAGINRRIFRGRDS